MFLAEANLRIAQLDLKLGLVRLFLPALKLYSAGDGTAAEVNELLGSVVDGFAGHQAESLAHLKRFGAESATTLEAVRAKNIENLPEILEIDFKLLDNELKMATNRVLARDSVWRTHSSDADKRAEALFSSLLDYRLALSKRIYEIGGALAP